MMRRKIVQGLVLIGSLELIIEKRITQLYGLDRGILQIDVLRL